MKDKKELKMKELYNFLTSLIETPTISGFESENTAKFAKLCLDYSEGFFESFEILPSGSLLFCRKCGKASAKKLVLDAHIDTIGFAVSELCGDGFVKVTNLGGVDPYILPSTPVKIYGKEELYAVFSSIPPHLSKKDENNELKISDLYVDTGLENEKLSKIVDVGTPVGFAEKPIALQNGIIASHSLDDKACVAAAVLCCRKLAQRANELCCDVYVHLSCGEERTALGAKTLPYVLDADACIVLDVNFAKAIGIENYESLVMGEGAGVSYSAFSKRSFTDFIVKTAKNNNIPIQSVVEMKSTGTNATQMHRNGIASAVLSVPLKNMHTFSEEVSLSDIDACAEVLAAVVCEFENFECVKKIV